MLVTVEVAVGVGDGGDAVGVVEVVAKVAADSVRCLDIAESIR